MLKFALWSLLALNALLLAYSQGLFGHGEEHEPARLKNQLNAGALRLVPAPAPLAPPAAAPPLAQEAPVATPAVIACLELGSFGATEARRFETRLASLQLGERMKRLSSGGADPTSYIVYIPPQASKEGADKKAGELKSLGVSDFFIMNDSSTMKYAISLGVFKSESAAQSTLAALVKKGVHSARLSPRGGSPARLSFQFRAIDDTEHGKIDKVAGSFQDVDSKACK
ncbi:SPOR domain-containing protein [Massilia sp. DWR3-1-1]|uniref:SPOR domain-containing protein n=1 Tax=Massilia sp. DWR3-1-1 TaxID=2804559 RepID=UPI003CF2999E